MTEADKLTVRNCDLINDMDYLVTCGMCLGDGRYEQTYTAGCGGEYFSMMGDCDRCGGTGIVTVNGGRVSQSHLAQINTRRQASREYEEHRNDQ